MPNYTYGRSHGRNPPHRRYGKYVTKNYLKAIVGSPESRYIDLSQSAVSVPNTGVLYPLNTTSSTLLINGGEVSNKSLHIRLNLTRQTVDSLVRVIVFWNMDGGAIPPLTNLLDVNVSGSTSTVPLYQAPINKAYGKTFWVKFDKTYTLAEGQTQLVVDEIWRRLKCKTEYPVSSADGSLTTSTTANTLLIAFISNQATAGNQPLLDFTSRVNFLDV